MKRYPRCIMATCCIPWNTDGQFDEPRFRRGVQATLQRGTRHLYVFGTAGEGYGVSETQFDQVVQAFHTEMTDAGAEPMVGIIHLSSATMVERIERCRNRGIRLFQISLPSWGALNNRELDAWFQLICGRFPDCRFMHYNLPRAKRVLTGVEYGRLAEAHPNLVATKNCGDSLSLIQSLQLDASTLQHFFSESGFVYGSLFGECGILASFVMNWERLNELLNAGNQRDIATMVKIQTEVRIVLRTVFEAASEGRIDGAYDKLYEKLYDPDFPLRLLPPYEGCSEEQFQQFAQLLTERLPNWVPAR